MFTKAIIKRYYLSELISYLKAIVQLCTDAGASALQIDVVTTALQNATKPVEAAYAYQKDSPVTIELETHDMERDNDVLGIKSVVDGYAKHFDPAIVAAANVIIACFNKYGNNIARLTYNAESEVVDKLIADFETDPKVVAALATLGITSWVAHLKASNNSFKAKYLERTTQYASQPQQSALALKPAAIAAYEKLIKHIDSRNTLDDTGKYTGLIQKIDALTDQYNTTVQRRTPLAKPKDGAPK
jgi:hypothetical protein